MVSIKIDKCIVKVSCVEISCLIEMGEMQFAEMFLDKVTECVIMMPRNFYMVSLSVISAFEGDNAKRFYA